MVRTAFPTLCFSKI